MKPLMIFLLITILLGCSVGEKQEDISKDREPNAEQENIKGNTPAQGDTKETNDPADNPESITDIQFTRQQSYGSTDEVVVGKITDIAVDDQNRVFIADGDQATIHTFGPDANYLKSVGKQGRGPAEFTAMHSRSTALKIDSNRLYVTDLTDELQYFPHRVQVFELNDLSFSHTIKLLAENKGDYIQLKKHSAQQIYPLNDETFIVAYRRLPHEYEDEESYIHYVKQDGSGNIVSEPFLKQRDITHLVYTYPNGYTILNSFSFFEKSLFAVSDDDQLYTTRSMDFNIDVHGSDGEQVRSFQHPFENLPLTRSGLIDWYEQKDLSQLDGNKGDDVALKMIREADNLPDNWPALETMFFDDEDRLWVATLVEDMDIYEWWILKKPGEVITKFEWPRDKPIEEVQNSYMYTLEADEMGVKSVVRYKIEMSNG